MSGKIRELLMKGMKPMDIARKLKCTPPLVYGVRARLAGGTKKNGSDGGLLPVPAVQVDDSKRQVMVPTGGEMELMLSRAGDGESLAALAKAAATLVEVAKRQDLMKQQLFEIAEWHLQVKRKLGGLLIQTISWGGDRSRCHDDTLLPGSLPKNLNRSAAKRCRRLAEIEESVFQKYLEKMRSQSGAPSEAGAVKFAAPSGATASGRKPRKKARSGVGDIKVTPDVLDAIVRCLGDIDVCAGGAHVTCRRRVVGAELTADDIRGIVLVTARVDPEVWLKQIAELRSRAQCDQVVVLLLAETAASWFRHFSGVRWHLCFLADTDEPVVAAYIGSRSEGFFAAMQGYGLVVSVHE